MKTSKTLVPIIFLKSEIRDRVMASKQTLVLVKGAVAQK